MSEHKSSNSLQNSVYSWSFGKEGRFKSYKNAITESMQLLPTTRTHRTTTLGFGERYSFKPLIGEGSPAPNKYNIRTCFDINIEHKKGVKIKKKVDPLVYKSLTL